MDTSKQRILQDYQRYCEEVGEENAESFEEFEKDWWSDYRDYCRDLANC